MKETLKLNAGQWVEVLSKQEILASLDKNGRLDGLPFMPQMFQQCGRRFRVFKRAHKSCDTVNFTGGLRMADAVHLEGIRCDGEAYGGCQALCLIYWKTAWLKPVDGMAAATSNSVRPALLDNPPAGISGCAESDVWAATRVKNPKDNPDEPTYSCQATEMLNATTPLHWWELSQYLEDYSSGNTGLLQMLRGFLYSCMYRLIQSGIGLGPMIRWSYDRVQAIWGGVPYPRKTGTIPLEKPTPDQVLNLQPGELVRVKSHQEILATLNVKNKNRGLYFDAESVPFCGRTYRVLRRVSKIIDEKTGKMVKFKNGSVILDGVYCLAQYSSCRLFCPRSIYPYWREIWLERVDEKDAAESKNQPALECSASGTAGASKFGHALSK